MKYFAEVNGEVLEMDIDEQGEALKVTIGDRILLADLQKISPPSLYSLILGNYSHEVFVEARQDQSVVLIGGERYSVKVQDERARRLSAVIPKERTHEGEVVIKAPMPGLVASIGVNLGDVVEKGKGLLVLEAMKMQNELRAPRAGTVKSIGVRQGERVENGRVLIVLT